MEVATPTGAAQGLPKGGKDTVAVSTPDVSAQAKAKPSHEAKLVDLNKELRGLAASMNAPGLQSYNQEYMPFASGFEHQVKEAITYRSARKTSVNPTAAVTDDVSYYYELDSGRIPPAAVAADPSTVEEFVRNTSTATQGGFWRKMMRPIQ